MERRVVITGIGAVTPVGKGRRELWRRLLAGHCGVGPVESFDTGSFSVRLGAEVRDFKPEHEISRLDPAALGRASQLAVAAARRALEDAALEEDQIRPERTEVAMGTTSGEPGEVEAFDDRWLADELDGEWRELASRYPCHVIAGQVAAELGFSGVNAMIPAACAAGNYALA